MKDMSDPAVQQEYDEKIYDGARDLAFKHKLNIVTMLNELVALKVPAALIGAVLGAQCHPDYCEENYRGKMVDESVVEALKDCLRPIHGFTP